ncbi:hypothetical protein [Bradyrhizobium sp. Leo170]|uniref:hypothetical protein n=1 Tax=Bradyrhizobium sp. Leo170 TaxID=1571199 RepID=UPI00102E6364|nr:hypothetical protein [Bradyrhizobium sp. Leo170]TAI67637.1 hypothetical protein CWO89_02130 [Bradyrhizobium sp. Leo170]
MISAPYTPKRLLERAASIDKQVEKWSGNAGYADTFRMEAWALRMAAAAATAGDVDKTRHHTISTAAALLNWHRHLSGTSREMRPGIDPVERGIETECAQ